MSYEEIISYVRERVRKTPVKKSAENVAVEFNISGEGEGAFYIEIKDGKIYAEPYEYYDHDAKIITTADELMRIINGENKIENSFEKGNLTIVGNIDIAMEIMDVFKKTAKKDTAKKSVKAEKKIVEHTKNKNSKTAKDIKK